MVTLLSSTLLVQLMELNLTVVKVKTSHLDLVQVEFIPGFEAQLVGHEAGEEVNVKVTFPEDYQADDLAGKSALFVTKIHEVKAKEVPALDDELAKEIDEEVETLDELKAKYRKELETAKEIAFDDAVEWQLLLNWQLKTLKLLNCQKK